MRLPTNADSHNFSVFLSNYLRIDQPLVAVLCCAVYYLLLHTEKLVLLFSTAVLYYSKELQRSATSGAANVVFGEYRAFQSTMQQVSFQMHCHFKAKSNSPFSCLTFTTYSNFRFVYIVFSYKTLSDNGRNNFMTFRESH